jgi:hypothetical protein
MNLFTMAARTSSPQPSPPEEEREKNRADTCNSHLSLGLVSGLARLLNWL